MNLQQIAKETVEALDRGSYTLPDGRVVVFQPELQRCMDGTKCYSPDELTALRDQILARTAPYSATLFAVANETTLQGCARLVSLADRGEYQRIGALNFASARNPGGGFLRGARAQEESLARSSGLYYSLRRCPDYYAYNRSHESLLYSDHMIYSPQCPVLRADNGNWLATPYLVDFTTSPAPNAGEVERNQPKDRDQIESTLRRRSEKLLALAAFHGCDVLVLGAWGCGVFRNDPAQVASIFRDLLHPEGLFAGRFRLVVFSVLDTSRDQATYAAFARHFGQLG